MKYTYLVYGCGRMGRAVVRHLLKSELTKEIRLVDTNEIALNAMMNEFSSHGSKLVPVTKMISLATGYSEFEGADVCIATCGYQHYVKIAEKCIKYGVGMVDLGGNRDVVRQQFLLNGKSEKMSSTLIPDCGLAPGLINVFGMYLYNCLSEEEANNIDISLKVGGLPFDPGTVEENPWQYKVTWSPDGLINEYEILADEIVDGKPVQVQPLTKQENFALMTPWKDTHNFEAFVTGGGSSNLPMLLNGHVRNMTYKTIRYPGHNAITKTFKNLGMFEGEPRKMLVQQLEKTFTGEVVDDIIIAIANAKGKLLSGTNADLSLKLFCRYEPASNLSAMAQTTGYSAAVVAQMIADGTIKTRGVCCGEAVIDGKEFITRLRSAGLSIGEFSSYM